MIPWFLSGKSLDNDENDIYFMFKNLKDTNMEATFKNKIEEYTGEKIEILRIYSNGQSFGQCGFWHVDTLMKEEYQPGYFTLVYYPMEWPPEYGGHLMIRTEEGVISFLPEKNRGVIFDSNLSHMALGPSRHCRTQRKSIAVKFKVEGVQCQKNN
jgi:Rps23 Pro-64 3,4-dihydroxylase Tpa1-like proline 4-hydroxylase